MPTRPKHPKPPIERAIRRAEQLGWRVVKSGGSAHCWGRLLCPLATPQGCIIIVFSTPKSPENHARQIQRSIEKCEHADEDDHDDAQQP